MNMPNATIARKINVMATSEIQKTQDGVLRSLIPRVYPSRRVESAASPLPVLHVPVDHRGDLHRRLRDIPPEVGIE